MTDRTDNVYSFWWCLGPHGVFIVFNLDNSDEPSGWYLEFGKPFKFIEFWAKSSFPSPRSTHDIQEGPVPGTISSLSVQVLILCLCFIHRFPPTTPAHLSFHLFISCILLAVMIGISTSVDREELYSASSTTFFMNLLPAGDLQYFSLLVSRYRWKCEAINYRQIRRHPVFFCSHNMLLQKQKKNA